ncbi:MAG: formimidoylglutamate deiminase [Boseongicola sp. SB0676_bin_33]|nr:formimidoylglutamate deiminase [Boseongicola sp. SB0676_bin_33]
MQIWAESALLPTGWASEVAVAVDESGRIASVETGVPKAGHCVGLLLPSPVNVHSHAYQRAMAGLTERRGPNPTDSFWTWRDLMFRFLGHLTPDHVEAIAAFVQMEMLEAGYSTNAEFHYLHHGPAGTPYDNVGEMSERIAAAADRTGIGLCLLPVHYEFGGCDGRGLGPGQVRFGNGLDRFLRLRDAARNALKALPEDAEIGVAPHSLRAVAAETLKAYADQFPAGPVHMHLAEQIPEVEEVLSQWGARPVEWALDHMALDDRWCLIHCTQMTPSETTRLAATGAVAGLCPITESSLGDGIFDGVRWAGQGGRLAVGSDSNIRIALAEELRTLDYSQRLRDHTRAAFATDRMSTGRRLFEQVLRGGAQAAGRRTGRLEAGRWADMLALDTTSVILHGFSEDTVLDAWIFAGDDRLVSDVWSAGRHKVMQGRHVARTEIAADYARAVDELKGAL